jgi:hypothetical protein
MAQDRNAATGEREIEEHAARVSAKPGAAPEPRLKTLFDFASRHLMPEAIFAAAGTAVGCALTETFTSPDDACGIVAGIVGSGVYSSDLPLAKKFYAVAVASVGAGLAAAVVRSLTGSPVASNAAGAFTAYTATKAGLWVLGSNRERRDLAHV